MNPALIKLSGRTYRSRFHTISHDYSHESSYPVNSFDFSSRLIKPMSFVAQFVTIFMTFSCHCF
ncbi:MAG: hypothetical protein ACRYGR_04595 [Janthinobacterium lividum]